MRPSLGTVDIHAVSTTRRLGGIDMNLHGFPAPASATIAGSRVAELATITAAGVPLDTPLLSWVGDDGTTVDLSTGLSYPAKAERARRNPSVGLLFEGDGTGPV